MIAAALAFSLFGLIHTPAIHKPGVVDMRHVSARPWRITLEHDRVSGETHCVMSGRGVKVYDDTLVVDLGRRADTSRAYFSLPDQAPSPAGVAVWPRNLPGPLVDRTLLENPSDGLVMIPLQPVLAGERLDVRQNLNARARKFDLKGLRAARQAAVQAGCPA